MRAKRGPYRRKPLGERFWPKVMKGESDECWLWQGYIGPNGYGQIHEALGADERVTATAHTVSWRLANKLTVPEGLNVLHTCDVRACVNPVHLYIGTQKDNCDDMWERDRAPKGEARRDAKLTTEVVAEIRRRYRPRVISQARLAREFGVSRQSVGRVVRGERW